MDSCKITKMMITNDEKLIELMRNANSAQCLAIAYLAVDLIYVNWDKILEILEPGKL